MCCFPASNIDERYVKAVKYPRNAVCLPKVVLIADIVGDDESRLNPAAEVSAVGECAECGRFHGSQPGKRVASFGLIRSRRGDCSATPLRSTKVVIPLRNLARYTEGIETINIRQSMQNSCAVGEFVGTPCR